MSKFVRGAGRVGIGLITLALLACLTVYLGGLWQVRNLTHVPSQVRVPSGGDVVEGARLAYILGCRGCHAEDLGGRVVCYEVPGEFSLACPNLTQARQRYSDQDLVILLRHGRKLDGTMVNFMPWDMYAHLNDQDLANVLAFLRSAPAVERQIPPSSFSWSTYFEIRWEMFLGEFPEFNLMSDYDLVPLEGKAERGRYLASIACPECHGPDLRGYEGDNAPSLVVAKAYSAEAFSRLMREGITVAGTESISGLMTAMGRKRFVHFTDEEVEALKAYLDERAP